MFNTVRVPRLLLAATRSGAGKTTVAVGMNGMFAGEFTLSSFKVGPDYIDPMFLSIAAKRRTINLDSWMSTKEALLNSFVAESTGRDLALIEGVMGLFDGRGAESAGSTAEVAKWLKCPVILVLDVAKTGQSAAAIVKGFMTFDPEVDIAGVFLNHVGSDSHLKLVREAIEGVCKIPVVGHLPNSDAWRFSSRHLGLEPISDKQVFAASTALARELAVRCDRRKLLEIAAKAPALPRASKTFSPAGADDRFYGVRVGIARDAAFSFYYQDNLRLLSELGAELIPFSPMADSGLPKDASGIYLGGGWPEMHAPALSANESMRSAIKNAAGRVPVYAECGGLLYLSEKLFVNGRRWPMAGVLPATTRMTGRRQGLGYREATIARPTVLGDAGTTVRGHEFHWSEIEERGNDFEYAYRYQDGRREGFADDNLLASFLHLNWAGRPELAKNFLGACVGGCSG